MDERENTDLKFRRSGWEKTAGDSVLFQMTQAVFQLRLGVSLQTLPCFGCEVTPVL